MKPKEVVLTFEKSENGTFNISWRLQDDVKVTDLLTLFDSAKGAVNKMIMQKLKQIGIKSEPELMEWIKDKTISDINVEPKKQKNYVKQV